LRSTARQRLQWRGKITSFRTPNTCV
jgi:hypothetical protein